MLLFPILFDNYSLIKRFNGATIIQYKCWVQSAGEVKCPILQNRFIRIEVPNHSSSVDGNISSTSCLMNLVTSLPVDVAAHLIGRWLPIDAVCMLEIALCSAEFRRSLMAIFERCILHSNLSLTRKQFAKWQVDWLEKRKVKVSQLSIGTSLSELECQELAKVLSRSASVLTSIEIKKQPHFGVLVEFLSTHCVHLIVLQVNGCELTSHFWELLAKLTSLKVLKINKCTAPWRSCEGLKVRCPSVLQLSITGDVDCEIEVALMRACCNATWFLREDGGEVDLGDIPATLQTLIVRNCDDAMFFGSFPISLTRVCIANTYLIVNDFEDLLHQSLHITHLNLIKMNCAGFDESIIDDIADAYSNTLEEFSASHCVHLTEAALTNLCTKCVHLHTLNISGNSHLPNSIYRTILNALPHLDCLNISNMNVSDAALRRIARSSLKTLIMLETTGYTADGLMALVDGCKCLSVIHISGDLINSAVVRMWERLRPNLEIMDE